MRGGDSITGSSNRNKIMVKGKRRSSLRPHLFLNHASTDSYFSYFLYSYADDCSTPVSRLALSRVRRAVLHPLAGIWPGSTQPLGLRIRAMLRRDSPLFTRPTNSSMSWVCYRRQ
jgi:hypothetical protein